MDITIKIDDDSRFKDILDRELEALSKDELKQVLLDGIKEALVANNYELAKKIFVDKAKSIYPTYGSYQNYNYEPSGFTKMLLQQLDYSQLQDILNVMMNDLKENHERLLKEVLFDNMIKALTDDYSFKERFKSTMFEVTRHN